MGRGPNMGRGPDVQSWQYGASCAIRAGDGDSSRIPEASAHEAPREKSPTEAPATATVGGDKGGAGQVRSPRQHDSELRGRAQGDSVGTGSDSTGAGAGEINGVPYLP